MNEPNYPSHHDEDSYDLSGKNKDAKKNTERQRIGDKPIRFSWTLVLGALMVMYFIGFMPTIISHYFSDLDTETMILGAIIVFFVIAVVFVIGFINTSGRDNKKTEKDEFTQVSNDYRIIKNYADKINVNTSVDADGGRCSVCGAKISRTNTNCPKCGRIIR